ncbi:hypothetical protein B0O99DRAFT_388471 [Bisporella sp. PMI_857]|nr:hypothetical protein B0O99DRAFT_388471 [Bisporella sp. PMI_857]
MMVSMRRAAESIIKPWKLPKPKTYILYYANVIDALHGKVHHGITVRLSGGLIESVIRTEEVSSRSNAMLLDNEIHVDCTGKYLCPGLIDCHVHVTTVPGEKTLAALFDMPADVSLLRQSFVTKAMLERGFTSARDCAGASLALKEAIEEDVVIGPRLFISGHGISQTGGHGDTRRSHDSETVCCGGHIRSIGRVADGVAECQKAVRDEFRTGADFIKIMCSGGVASPTDRLEETQYSAEEILAMTTIARNKGSYVTAHAYTPAAIKQAVENGVRGIEHGNLIDKETAELMALKGAFLTSTLVTYATLADPDFGDFLPPQNAAKNKEVLDLGLKSLELARDAGVTMCFGTDLLGPMHHTQTKEFGLRKPVLDAKTILQSCTVNAAKLLMQENHLGQIKEKFVGDILILNKNPLEDIEVLDRQDECLLAVIKGGRVYSSRWTKLPIDTQPVKKLIE